MPQADFYLCEPDLLEIGRIVFDDGGVIIPDLNYSSPEPKMITTQSHLKRVYDQTNVRLFFIVAPRWQKAPLTIREIQRDGQTVFFISQKNGGPSIEVFCPRPVLVEGRLTIAPGFVGYHKSFWNPMTGNMELVDDSLKRFFEVIKSRLSEGGRKIAGTKRRLLITENTVKAGLSLFDLKKDDSG